MTKKPVTGELRVFGSFFVTFTPAMTSILMVEGSNHFWIITQSILNRSEWLLARKIQKIRGDNPTKSETHKTLG